METANKKKNIWGIIGVILTCLILVPILVVNLTLIVKSYTNKDEVPSIGKTVPMVVLTDSMYPKIDSGDLIFVKKTKANKIEVGDIISFYDPAGNGSSTLTHRVKEIETRDGKLYFTTKGDANNVEDAHKVSEDALIGIYKSKINELGHVALFLSSTEGLIICIIVPLAIFLGFDLVRKSKIEKKNKEEKENLLLEIERLKKEKELEEKKLEESKNKTPSKKTSIKKESSEVKEKAAVKKTTTAKKTTSTKATKKEEN
ncbi:MAG: signal peptidase I [Erysipelotrichaceae bacterium]|nr:signal peptidase I [Erysipelotrichaceae bacterium]